MDNSITSFDELDGITPFQKMHGRPTPRTMVDPVIPPRLYDSDKINSMYGINKPSTFYSQQSGMMDEPLHQQPKSSVIYEPYQPDVYHLDSEKTVSSHRKDCARDYGISDTIEATPLSEFTHPIRREFPHYPEAHEVYDARAHGFGEDGRRYIHPVTGAPQYFYDDVDATRRQQYIVRSKIDHMTEADSSGYYPMDSTSLTDLQTQADQDYITQSDFQREELSAAYSRRYMEQIGHQRRKYPIRRF